jgi:deazaflavin-dependent oxidoreductase (nitroreductase family)
MAWDPAAFERQLIEDMRAHGGRPSSGPMAGQPLMVLTTTGAKSGEPRTAIVTYHRDGDAWVVAGSKSGADTNPAWYYNLLAKPEAMIEVDNRTFPVRAKVESSGPERDRLWNDHVAELPAFGEYPKQTNRVIPMIVLEKAEASRA